MKRKDGGHTISDRRHHTPAQIYQTGQLDRRTLLHKRYHIQRVIGQGGMGAVYQAKDLRRQGEICAIKEMGLSMVPPEEQAQAIENFKSEAKMLWGLKHPNLPGVTGFFSEFQRYYLVMEFIDGLTLEELLERNNAAFPERRVLGWARQLCDVLEFLHSQNPPIIFRDMKPGNIMLMRNGQIKLIDFGIARFFRPTDTPDTQLLGTPGYAPPEQYGKAQTDARSDIYALGMTLFQLLTNKLSEKGFGLHDVRMINPQLSAPVAHALEKATSLDPENRYENVQSFRRALFGEGTFVFENGDIATTPAELAQLCMNFPDEAADYLSAGEIELWLHEIGETSLSRAAATIRTSISDPQRSVEQLLHTMGARRHRPPVHENGHGTHQAQSSLSQNEPDIPHGYTKPPRWLTRKQNAPVQVSPYKLDFGQVHPAISSPLLITISNPQEIHGTIRATEPWISVDQAQFDDAHTYVQVRVNSMKLHGNTHYTGSVMITPETPLARPVAVKVEVDVQQYPHKNRGKTIVPDLDDEEDEEPVYAPGQIAFSQGSSAATLQQIPISLPKDTHAQSAMNGTTQPRWDPWPITPKQRVWQLQGLTFASAFMAASLLYTLFVQNGSSPLPPNPWFIAVLAAMMPTATLGALLARFTRSWRLGKVLDHAITSMASILPLLAVLRLAWQLTLRTDLGPVQMVLVLMSAALAATIGSNTRVSDYIIDNVRGMVSHLRWLANGGALFIGGGLGYLLTAGLGDGPFTVFGILVGMGVMALLVWRVDYLLKYSSP